MNSKLLSEFATMEVKDTVFQMAPLSSQAQMDSLPISIKQIGPSLEKRCLFVQKVLQNGWPLHDINDTIITLIPKVK